MKSAVIVFILIVSVTIVFCNDPKKVAIIGGGIGGTSCAKFLNDLLGDNVEIDLYESEEIGGRLSGILHKDRYYEIGAPMMIDMNYVADLVKEFQLKTKDAKHTFSIFEKEKLTTLSNFKMIFQSPSIIKTQTEIFHYLDNEFAFIYSRQKDYKSIRGARTFTTAYQMFSTLEQKKIFQVKRSFLKILESIKVSDYVIRTLTIASRKEYGENLNIPPVVGYVSLLQSLYSNKTFSILGGNQKLAEKCFQASGANLISKKIIGLTSSLGPGYKSKVIWMENGKQTTNPKEYDFVVLAIPLAENLPPFKFLQYGRPIKITGGRKFVDRVITILEGKLNLKYFKLQPGCIGSSNIPRGIVFFDHGYIDYILKLDGTDIWKIQSKRILTYEERSIIFEEKSVIIQKEWKAYPDYKSHKLDDNDELVLANNLLYLNSIEWAASSIEMSIISAKNAAIAIGKAIFLDNPVTP